MLKSLYVKKGAYVDIPKALINYTFLKEKYGMKGFLLFYKGV